MERSNLVAFAFPDRDVPSRYRPEAIWAIYPQRFNVAGTVRGPLVDGWPDGFGGNEPILLS
jgi:hypothetical protein